MSLFRRTHAEVAGAWRSLRYDLGRRPAEPRAGQPGWHRLSAAGEAQPDAAQPDVTCTGMNTFAVDIPDEPATGPAEVRRRPRRALAVTALVLLAAAGTAGAYLAVANGLGSLLREKPTAAEAFSQSPAVTAPPAPNAGIGSGPVMTTGSRAMARAAAPAAGADPAEAPATPLGPDGGAAPPAIAGGTAPATAGRTAVRPVPKAPGGGPAPVRTAHPSGTECDCPQPPVPTPTAPSGTPSPTASPEPTPADSAEPSASPGTPDDSPDPSDSARPWQGRRPR